MGVHEVRIDPDTLTEGLTKLRTDDAGNVEAQQRPQLPLEGYNLFTSVPGFDRAEEQDFLRSLSVTLEEAHRIEENTRDQSFNPEWHKLRRPRVTASTFRQVCHFRDETTAESGIKDIIQGGPQTADMRRGLELEPEIIAKYEKVMKVTRYPCGLVIHPDIP